MLFENKTNVFSFFVIYIAFPFKAVSELFLKYLSLFCFSEYLQICFALQKNHSNLCPITIFIVVFFWKVLNLTTIFPFYKQNKTESANGGGGGGEWSY